MRRLIVFIPALVLCLLSAAAVPAARRGKSPRERIEARMRAELRQTLPFLEPDERRNVVLVDTLGGWSYSRRHGLRRLRPAPKDSQGLFRLRDGTRIPPAYEGGIRASSSLYTEYRLVRSNPGYRKVECNLMVPAVTGADMSGEAAYNYFGLKTSAQDFEAGLYTNTVASTWKVYHSLNGAWAGDNWPASGIPPYSATKLRFSVPQDNQVSFYVWYQHYFDTPGEQTFVYSVPGARADGAGQQLRRNTSLLLNSAGTLGTDAWSSIQIGTPTDLHLWLSTDTYNRETTSRVAFDRSFLDYDETIHIYVP
jgi:hypothetical protein